MWSVLGPVLISAGVGAATSWLTARRMVRRQESAKEMHEARSALEAVFARHGLNARRFDTRHSLGAARDAEVFQLQDINDCHEILGLVDQLGRVEQWRLRRHLTVLYGEDIINYCELTENPDLSLLDYSLRYLPDAYEYLVHRAYTSVPTSPETTELVQRWAKLRGIVR